ncbi:hypothetical protein [Streptomyces sp. NPDC005890]
MCRSVVDNAGVPSTSVFEGTPMARVREVPETNTAATQPGVEYGDA